MPSWPVGLPSPLVNGFNETLPNNTIRTEMDVGAAKVRRRTTSNPYTLTVPYLLSSSQVDDLIDFYQTDTSYGAIAFDFIHPRSGDIVSCRFLSPPQLGTSNGSYFPTSIQLEVLP